ncbi:subtilase family protein [Forsythia ovata]|uniref:Subtilase family protein n=1 Tax=Forsythia ovata TaxID=205694 RepID=A0ABD1R780_9LAMI
MEEVVSVFRSHPKKYSLHTTRSWEFVGLEERTKPYFMKKDLLLKSKYGNDVIVGMLDNGVKDGHGTHTASTVGGRRVPTASAIGGFARGTASGGAPLVRLAIYKVCWAVPGVDKDVGNMCFEEDMLGAMDDAIADGVDVN